MSLSSSSTIDAMISLAKNSKLTGRAEICAGVIAILIRITCFPSHVGSILPFHVDNLAQSKPQKKTKKGSSKAASQECPVSIVQGLSDTFLASIIELVSIAEKSAPYSESFVNIAMHKLLILLADFGNMSVDHMANTRLSAAQTPDKKDPNGISFLDVALVVLNQMLMSDMQPCREFEGDEDTTGSTTVSSCVQKTCILRSVVKKESVTTKDPLKLKLAESFYSLIVHSLFQSLTFPDIGVFHVFNKFLFVEIFC